MEIKSFFYATSLVVTAVILHKLYYHYRSTRLLEHFYINENVRSQIWTYSDLKNWTPTDSNPKAVPKLLFRTGPFKVDALPTRVEILFQSIIIQNPEYKLVYFDDDDCMSFISHHFSQYLDAYNVLVPGAYKADLWRLLVLYKYGGIYNDIAHQYLVPVSEIVLPTTELLIVKDADYQLPYNIYNAFMVSHPNHPVIHAMITHIVHNVHMRVYGDGALDITGPQAIGRAFNLYFNRDEASSQFEGQWSDKGHVFSILKHVYLSDDQRFVTNNGIFIISCKFPGYYQTLYDKKDYYATHWDNRTVYKSVEG